MPAKRPASRALPPRLEDLPNVGRAVAADFRRLGIGTPDEIRGRDPYMLYHDLCRATRALVDPCMLDTFIAVVRYVDGGPAKPWWHYTAERKRTFPGSAKALAKQRGVEDGSKRVGPKPGLRTSGRSPPFERRACGRELRPDAFRRPHPDPAEA